MHGLITLQSTLYEQNQLNFMSQTEYRLSQEIKVTFENNTWLETYLFKHKNVYEG
ncbi:hypothetical protein Hanom_Chr11g01032101 [Helianthus anomalus]